MNALVGVGVCALLSFFALKKQILNTKGVLTAFLVGTAVTLLGGFRWLIILVSFVLIAFASTSIGYEKKKELDVLEGEHGERKTRNVVANAVIPVAIVVIYWFNLFINPKIIQESFISLIPFLTSAYVGSISTATSDTLASEIGTLDTNTHLIINFKKVEPGENGGISFLGEIASLAGALIIGVISFFVYPINNIVLIAFISGVIGCHIDSLLGATLEQKKYLNNEHVNFFATLTGAIIGGLLSLI